MKNNPIHYLQGLVAWFKSFNLDEIYDRPVGILGGLNLPRTQTATLDAKLIPPQIPETKATQPHILDEPFIQFPVSDARPEYIGPRFKRPEYHR